MTETVPNSASAAIPSSAQHSAAWLHEPSPNTLRLSAASTSSKHGGAHHHFHHRHPRQQMNHHGSSAAAPRYLQSIRSEEEQGAEEYASSSGGNSSYRIHDSSFEESVDSPKLLNIAVSTHSKRWTQFEDSEEYGSGSDDESNEDTDDGQTVDDYDDGSDKPHMSSDTETRNLLADVGDEDDDIHSSSGDSDSEDDDLTESVDVPDSGTLTGPKKSRTEYSHSFVSFANETLYEMSRDQREYYERCFLHLMLSTQGKASRSGAVNGADDRVVEFFKKSYLDSDQLSRIWMLSDVNEDGWLNMEEFSMAMHLIVLHVKGRNPIPAELPARVRPVVTPVRGIVASQPVPTHSANSNSVQASLWTSTASDPSAETSVVTPRSAATITSGKQNWKQFDFDKTDSSSKGCSLSDEQLHNQEPEEPPTTSAIYKPPVAQFSDVPPILVDSRPTPLKSSQPLSCRTTAISTAVSEGASQLTGIRFPLSPQNGPKGPPPKPPPRPANRGHGRSASLDLNSMAFTTTSNTMSSSAAAAGSNQLPSPPGVSGYPQIPAKERGSTLPASLQLSSMVSRPPPVVPPPRKIPLPHTPVTVSVASQTDVVEVDRMLELNMQLEERLERLNVTDCDKTNWKERCEMMRRLNCELEAERAKLAQIRLQLELRIQEVEQGRGPSKPTSL